MPIYEYRCMNGHTFDVMQRFSDEPVTVCEVCGAESSRVFHAPAVHFKGSGFYNTDYGTRKRSREKEGAESTGESSSGDGKDAGGGKEGKGGEAGKGGGKEASSSPDSGSKGTSSEGGTAAKTTSD